MTESLFVVKEGWLTKQGGLFKTWHRRWFSLVGKELFYYKEQGNLEKGKINLSEATKVDFAPEIKKKNTFKIVIPTRTYILTADSPSDMESWMTTLKRVIMGDQESTTLTEDDVQISQSYPETPEHKICEIFRKADPSTKYIMKTYPRANIPPEILKEHLDIRAQHLKRKIPYVTQLKFVIQSDTSVSLISERLPMQTLEQLIEESGKMSEEKAKIYIAQIITGLDQLHKDHINYIDLKPSNILIDEDGYLSLTDPGIKDRSKRPIVTPYTAPELLPSKERLPNSGVFNDWYVVGVLLYEMICGLPPYWDSTEDRLITAIKSGPLLFPNNVSCHAKNIIRKLLDRNVITRLGSGESEVEEIKRNPFFNFVSWELVLAKRITIPRN